MNTKQIIYAITVRPVTVVTEVSEHNVRQTITLQPEPQPVRNVKAIRPAPQVRQVVVILIAKPDIIKQTTLA